MQPATTLTMASVGLAMTGSGTSLTRMSRGAWMVVARMCAILAVRHTDAPCASKLCYLISEIPWIRMTTDYKGRIGNLIRDARKHRGLTQQQLAELLVHQPERHQPDREGPPEPLPRDAGPDRRRARLRDRRPRRRPHPPARQRADHALGQHRRQDLQERRCRAALRLAAQPWAHHPAQGRPDRGGQPAARGAQQPRRADPLAQQRQRPRDHPAGRARPRRTSTRRPRGVPAR